MPPKNKKPANAAERAKDVQETEDPLQALVLADSFETRFSPFTLERPRCLLPLANTPLIEYTLQFLANSGVEEVFVYCGAHTDQIEEYLQLSKWTQPTSPFRLELIRSVSKSIGDAMRDLDNKGIMTGDFVVVYGDIVSNLPLGNVLAEHRERRAKDKNAIMTMVLREAGVEHRTKAQGPSPMFVVDPSKNRCLHYEQMSKNQPNKYIHLDPEIVSNHQELDLRHDLIDCGIDICTPDVLALWSDNFDYEAPRRNFLHSVLKDYELNGKTIHTHIIKHHYAARVRNLHAFDSLSRDIISRWTYPVCPDSNLMEGQTYRFRKGNIYQENNVDLAWTANIGSRCVLGRGTKVGEESRITHSVIGRNCHIGDNCVIENSYIWDGATIGHNSVIRRSILANNVTLGRGCDVQEGALISYGVKVADGVVIAKRQRMSRVTERRKSASMSSEMKTTGTEGAEYEYIPFESEDDDTKIGLVGPVYGSPGFSTSNESISTLESEESSIDEQKIDHMHTMSFLSVASDDTHGAIRDAGSFHHDAVSSIYDALKEGTEVSTIQLELQSLRMTANATEHQVRRAVVTALVRYLIDSGKQDGHTIKTVLEHNTMLLERIMFDKEKESKDDQVDFLLLVQKDLSSRKKEDGLDGMIVHFCNALYLTDVLEQEALEQWWEDERSRDEEGMRRVRKQAERFMEVLTQAGSDSESEDDDEDEDEDGDEDE